MARKKWIVAVIAVGWLAACCLAGLKGVAKTADPIYVEDPGSAMDVPAAAGDARPGWSSRAMNDQETEQYLNGMSYTPQGSGAGPKAHAARVARTSDKTAAQASTRAAISPTLSWLDWRRAFGPLLSWWVLPIPLAAAAIAAVAWITSLVVRRPSRRGVPPLAIFEPEGPVIAPLPRQEKRPRRAA